MPKKVVQVEVESSAYDLGQAFVTVVKAAKAAKASGAPMAAQVTEDLMACISAFAPVAGEMGQVPADLADSKEEFAKAMSLVAFELYDAVKA